MSKNGSNQRNAAGADAELRCPSRSQALCLGSIESKHAQLRSQQRGLPPFVDFLLDEFGDELHDGRGGIRIFFSHRSVRRMEQAFGHQPVAMFKRYFTAYRIDSARDGCVITRGWRTKRIPHA